MMSEQMSQGLSIQGTLDPVSVSPGVAYSPAVNLSEFKRALFILDVGVFGSSATVDMTLQVSNDNSAFTDLASTVLPGTSAFSNYSITQLVASGGNNRSASLEIRADQVAAVQTPALSVYVRAKVTVGVAATLLSVVALGGESIQKPGSQYDAATVAQRQVVDGPS